MVVPQRGHRSRSPSPFTVTVTVYRSPITASRPRGPRLQAESKSMGSGNTIVDERSLCDLREGLQITH